MTPTMRAALHNLNKNALIDLVSTLQDQIVALRIMNNVILLRGVDQLIPSTEFTPTATYARDEESLADSPEGRT